MDRQMLVGRLNDLLGMELRGLLGRLDEVHSFVEPEAVAALPVFEQILADERDHRRRLTEAVAELGGVPRPRTIEMTTARVHYLGARYLLPLLIAEKRKRVAAYEQAAAEISSLPAPGVGGQSGQSRVAALVGGILARHQAHLEQLEALAARMGVTNRTPSVSAGPSDRTPSASAGPRSADRPAPTMINDGGTRSCITGVRLLAN